MLPDARDIAAAVPMRSILRTFGWRVRSRNRADCGLCRGGSTGTLAFTERLWKCHRCNEGGDAFSLVRAVNRCDFPAALHYVAELAGVSIPDSRGVDVRSELEARKERQKRVEGAAEKLEALEKALRFECRDRIHEAERLLFGSSTRDEWHWKRAQAACVLRDQYLLPEYALVAFGAMAERTRYVLHPELRTDMVSAIRLAGGLHDDSGIWVEVPA